MKIPTFESTNGIKVTGTPELSLAPARESAKSLSGLSQSIQGVFTDLAKVEEAREKVRDFRQTNEASLLHSQNVRDIETLARDDPDINPDKYTEELDKKTTEVANTMTDGLAKEQFLVKAKQQNIVTAYGISNLHRKQQIDGSKAILLLKKEQLQDGYGDMTDIQRHVAVADWKSTLNDALKSGVANKAELDLIDLNTQKKLQESVLNSDRNKDNATSINESYVYQQLKLGKDGDYPWLSSEDRAKELSTIESKVRRNELLFTFQRNEDHNQNERQMLVDASEGKLTPERVKDGLLGQTIRLSFGEKMLKKVYANPNPDTDYTTYNKVREMQLTDAAPQEINQFIVENFDKLSNPDKKFLIDSTYSEADKKKNTIIRYNSEALKNWGKDKLSMMPGVQADLIYEFHRRVNQDNAQGQAIDVIAQELQKEKIKEIYPESALMDDVPNFTADRNRLKKVYGKESKLKGKPLSQKPAGAYSAGMGFDDF
jgi:hypothetical protein